MRMAIRDRSLMTTKEGGAPGEIRGSAWSLTGRLDARKDYSQPLTPYPSPRPSSSTTQITYTRTPCTLPKPAIDGFGHAQPHSKHEVKSQYAGWIQSRRDTPRHNTKQHERRPHETT